MSADHPLIRSHRYDAALHDASSFDCGEPSLNGWIRTHAEIAWAMKTAATYVWTRGGIVLGFYAVATHALVREHAPHTVGRNAPDPVPAFIIGQLALDRSMQGDGNGGALLLDALVRLFFASEDVPARVVVVDAISDPARQFYLRHGFRDIPNQPMRLHLKTSDAAIAIAAAIQTS